MLPMLLIELLGGGGGGGGDARRLAAVFRRYTRSLISKFWAILSTFSILFPILKTLIISK